MRIYSGQARLIARELIELLVKEELIELLPDQRIEAQMDVESILREYIRNDREINEEARDTVRARGLGNGAMGRIKRRLAKERGFGIGDEAREWLVQQTIEMLLYSNNIDEVYAEDRELRRAVNRVLNNYTNTDNEIDREARSKLKNLEEGSAAWDIEYQRAMDAIKRNKGLT